MSGVISGNFGVQIFGPGSVAFSGGSNNTYTGSTSVVSSGTLLLSGTAIVLVPGNLNIGVGSGAANSAKVKLTSAFSDLIVDTSKVTIASDGQLDMGSRSDTIAQLLGTGSVTMSGSNILTVGDTGNFTFGGVISGTGNVNKVGTGTMTYTAANTYTGITIVSRGTLVLNAPSFAKAIRGSLTIGLNVGTVTTATLLFANSSQFSDVCNTQIITINSDGKLDNGGFTDTVRAGAMNGGSIELRGEILQLNGDLTMVGGTISGAGTLRLFDQLFATATSALGPATINSDVVLQSPSTTTFTVNGGSAQPELTIGGPVRTGGSNRDIIKTGTGTLRLAGTTANDYGGSTTVEQGVLELDKPGGVTAITGPIVIGNGAEPAGSAVLRNLATQQIGGKPSVTINASGAFNPNSPSLSDQWVEFIGSLSGTGSLLMPNFSNLVIETTSGSATFGGTLSSQLSATSLIQKRGAGEQIFTGNGSAYVARSSVAPGRLTVNSPGVLGSHVEIDNGGELGGTGQIGSLTVYNGGRVRPGNGSGGALSVGTTRFETGSSLVIDATNTNVGRLNVTGPVTIDPTAVLELHAAPTFSVPEGNFATFVINDGADAIQGTFRGLPEGRSAPAGPRNVTISYVGGDGNDATLGVRKTVDIDGDSQYLAETDGLLIARYIRGLTGPALNANAVATSAGARRTVDTDIQAYLTHLGVALDVDLSGVVDSTDSLLILRYLFGFRGTAMVAGVTPPVGVTINAFAATVQANIAALTPP